MKSNRYYLSAFATFIIFGFISLPVRALHGYSPNQILFYRVTFALLCLLIILVGFKRSSITQTLEQYRSSGKRERSKFLAGVVLGSLFLTANWLSFIYVINQINVQTGSFSYLLCPILTTMLGFLLLKEKSKPAQWAAIGISVLACTLIGVDSLRNLLFSLVVATTYAFYLITQRILRHYDRLALLALQMLLSFLFLNMLGLHLGADAPQKPEFYLYVFSLGSIFTVLTLFLNAYALKGLPASTMGMLMYINPVINFFVAFLYYGERASLTQWVAYALIFGSVIISNVDWKRLLENRRRKVVY